MADPLMRPIVAMLLIFGMLAALSGCGDSNEPEAGVAPGASPSNAEAPAGEWAGPLRFDRPDRIIVLMMDTLRADVVGAYGSTAGLTPHMDAFAEEAIVFEHAYATSSWTRPVVASMFTARYPSSHTVLDKEDALPAEALTLVEILEADADTWSFGITTNANISTEVGFGQSFDRWGALPDARRRRYPEDRIGLVPADEVTAAMLEMLTDERGAAAERTFGFAQFIDPHAPYYPNHAIHPADPPPEGDYAGSRTGIDDMLAAGPEARTDRNIAWLRWLYDGEVAYLDRAFGEFIAALKERDLYEDSLIIVVSDHGEQFFEHGQFAHAKSLYEVEARVPFMIRFPGMPSEHARRIERPVSVVDLAPTVLDALDLPVPDEFEGRSLIPFIETGKRDERLDYVFSELAMFAAYSEVALRHDRYKMRVRYWHERTGADSVDIELYNVIDDPGETRNLARDEAHREAYRDLLAELSRWEADVSEWSLGAGREVDLDSLDEQTRNELRGLGYIQ
jgi:arylsulfatase A-like enzyme